MAFPSISTGVYGYPIEQAVTAAFDAVLAQPRSSVNQVRFVLFSDADLAVYKREYARRGLDRAAS